MKKLLILMAAVLLGCCLSISCKKGDSKVDKPQGITDSLKYFTEQIAKNPKDAELYYARAKWQFVHELYEEAALDMRHAIDLKNDVAKYYLLSADINFKQNQLEDAEENLKKALELDNENNEIRIQLAKMYYLHGSKSPGRYDDCLSMALEAISKHPMNPDAYYLAAQCYAAKGDTATYLHRLLQVVEQNPNDVRTYLELGYFYQKHDDATCLDYYQNALRADATNAEILYNMGTYYKDHHQYEAACEKFQILVKSHPDGAFVKLSQTQVADYVAHGYYNMGVMYFENADYQTAVTNFTEAIKRDDVFASAHLNRGQSYEELGNWVKAKADYEMARDLVSGMHAKEFKEIESQAIAALNALDKKKK